MKFPSLLLAVLGAAATAAAAQVPLPGPRPQDAPAYADDGGGEEQP
ncbi:MAG TPA: hypothetical protein VHA55_02900 [Pseudorhodoplanes sp.]|nr:hypothetical protein [Pseudorhodoplanes sp.]